MSRIFKGQIILTKDGISCKDVKFKTIIWEYICWTLAGKPSNHSVDTTR